MPLLGFLLITALPMSDAIAVGVLIMACMPGGTTSNMFTYFARGNLSLSVLMTMASTVLGVVAIPRILSVYASALDLVIPTSTIIATLAMLLVPVGLGLAIGRWSLTAGERTERIGSALVVIASVATLHFRRRTTAHTASALAR